MTSADRADTRTTPERPSPNGGASPLHLVLRSAGVAGMAFALLFVASLLLVCARPPDGLDGFALVDWHMANALGPVTLAAPFAGIAFLWFIGLVRTRIGAREDQLFATVFLGSGLLFVSMYWAGAAQFASLVAGNRFDAAPPLTAAALEAVRSSAFSFLFVLAARAGDGGLRRRPGDAAEPLVPAVGRVALPVLGLPGQRRDPGRGVASPQRTKRAVLRISVRSLARRQR